MMRRLKKPPRALRLAANDALDAAGKYRKWASTKATRSFRADLTAWCMKHHKRRCSYCSLDLGIDQRRSEALDHFVPKGGSRGITAWTYEVYNLLLACHSCNSKLKQSGSPLVSDPSRGYKRAEFDMVHPYLDRVEEHITGGYRGGRDEVSTPRWLTSKGRRTVELFKLNSPGLRATWEGEQIRHYANRLRSGWGASTLEVYTAALAELEGKAARD